MRRVSLVGTVHEELGCANASELCAILERIDPEVLFLEVPPAAFDDFYVTFSRTTLESSAVNRFGATRRINLVPVDLPTPVREFFENVEFVRKRIRHESATYRRLLDDDRRYIVSHGFAYLNSEVCSNLWAEVYREMKCALDSIGDRTLVDIFDVWTNTIDLRETHMLTAIDTYCQAHAFSVGAFLIGAAHRQPIIDRVNGQKSSGSPRAQWDFQFP